MLALAVVRDAESRDRARARIQTEVRDTFVGLVREFYVSFFEEIDFGRFDESGARMPQIAELLDGRYWKYADDAYITNLVHRVGEGIASGEIGLNPLGAYDAESARLRTQALSLMETAYNTRQPVPEGEVVALPLYRGRAAERERWGAAYIRVKVPPLPVLPSGLGLPMLAAALGSATLVAMGLVFLLLHALVLSPLRLISAGAERVARGQFATPVPLTGKGDEIDELIRSFNGMMAEIGQKREELERQVQEVVARMRLTERRLVLTDRLAAMGTLAAGIAHEINNPLGGMLNAVVSLRRRGDLAAGADRYLALVEDGLGRIREVVRRTLRFSPGRRMTGPVSIKEVIDDAVRFVGHRLARERIDLSEAADSALVVEGDAAALGQVFLNVILNAIDAIAREPRRIEIRAWREGAEAHVTVRDSGRGMNEEERRQAFDLFYTTKEAGRGTGLGLSIAHQIVVEHGGRVGIESEPGRGTVVLIVLPAK
ncbi:MAG: HAMP domain-containing protein [Planctomycetes bacterium]|nr:HAMP domain-containing protein [Planctomycetota bacterium]